MSVAHKYWYLNKHSPVRVVARQTSECTWYLPELNISVDGNDLFRTSTGVLRALKRKIDDEIKRRQSATKPHPKAQPTKYRHLWLVEGGLPKNKQSNKKTTNPSGTSGKNIFQVYPGR